LPKRNAGHTDARGDPEDHGRDGASQTLCLYTDASVGGQVGDQEFLTADACDDRVLVGVVAENIGDGD
jgi:hypothetical protein